MEREEKMSTILYRDSIGGMRGSQFCSIIGACLLIGLGITCTGGKLNGPRPFAVKALTVTLYKTFLFNILLTSEIDPLAIFF